MDGLVSLDHHIVCLKWLLLGIFGSKQTNNFSFSDYIQESNKKRERF